MLGFFKVFVDNGYEMFWMLCVLGVWLFSGEYADWRRVRERFAGDVCVLMKVE